MSREDLPERRRKSTLRQRMTRKALGRVYETVEDTVVPRTEDFIFDIFSSIIGGLSNLVIGAFEGLVYREDDYDRRPRRGRDRRYGEREYYEYYERKRRRRRDGESSVQRKEKKRERDDDAEGFTEGLISCKNWNEIYYDNRRTPERLLRQLKKDAARYDGVRMEVLYEYLKKTGGDFTETYQGWKNLDQARVQPDGPRQYWLRLPEPVDLDLAD